MSLECPVCLDLPEGEVHQCNEGHCYCAACWNRLEEPRRCPECRQPIPQANRNRAAERAIAALEASCEHCGEATTRGALAAHINSCPFRPTTCAAAAAGCGWAGMLSEQAAHKAACPFAICQQMMAPLQAQNRELQVRCQELHAQNQVQHSHNQRLQAQCDGLQAQNQQLQSECQQLRARVAAVEPLQVRCAGLQSECQELRTQNQQLQARVADLEPLRSQNEQLQQQVAALQPLAGRVRALEGAETEGGQRRRQRVGPAPHDVPPSDAAIAEMGLAEMVAALLAHLSVARVAAKACGRLTLMCDPADNKHAGAEAGVIEAVIAAMRAHTLDSSVQVHGCAALYSVCGGTSDAASRARRQRATQAGGRTAVAAARQAHPADGPVKTVCTVLLRVLPIELPHP